MSRGVPHATRSICQGPWRRDGQEKARILVRRPSSRVLARLGGRTACHTCRSCWLTRKIPTTAGADQAQRISRERDRPPDEYSFVCALTTLSPDLSRYGDAGRIQRFWLALRGRSPRMRIGVTRRLPRRDVGVPARPLFTYQLLIMSGKLP